MQIVLVHGYFLKGTGSNIFVKNACRELCEMGHDVLLFCQENSAEDIDFIEKVFDFNIENSLLIETHKKDTEYPGKCTLYRPNLNGFLPVFVYDEYSGYEVKEFTSASKEELGSYIENNKNAINCAVEGKRIDLVWSNHSVMQPVYVARSVLGKSKITRVLTPHGSCLNFSVRKSEMLKEYALEAIQNNDKIAFVSKFSKDEFLEFFNNDEILKNKSVVIYAGADLDIFMPLNNSNEKNATIENFLIKLSSSMKKELEDPNTHGSSWKTDVDVISKIRQIDFEKEKIVLYYGKYLWTKGLQIIIAAAPLILQKIPNARFVFVGYGAAKNYFEAIIDALNSNQKRVFFNLIQHPEKFDIEIDEKSSRFFKTLIKQLEDADFSNAYFTAAENVIKSKIVFTGFLQHEHLKTLIACSDVTVAPSIFSEAFGLVAVEALASGAIPILTNQSGFAEVIEEYVEEFSDIFDPEIFTRLRLNENLTINLAKSITDLLICYGKMEEKDKKSLRERARKVSFDNYSWKAMCGKYLSFVN